MFEGWIRRFVPDYRSKRELIDALKRYENANICRIDAKLKVSNHDLFVRMNDSIMEDIEENLFLNMIPMLKRHLHMSCSGSIKENATYFTAHIDVADNWEGNLTHEQGYSYRKPDARS